jgi:hypothetical protein
MAPASKVMMLVFIQSSCPCKILEVRLMERLLHFLTISKTPSFLPLHLCRQSEVETHLIVLFG